MLTLGERERGTNRFEESVRAFGAALEVYTPERNPHAWAATHVNLGNVLLELGERERDLASVEKALAAYRLASDAYARTDTPAKAKNSLGNALLMLGVAEGDGVRIAQALGAYQAALEESTREQAPLDWAMTQNNIGNALNALASGETGVGRLEEAVRAYRAALEERTRERVPLDWAMTQSNLADALLALSKRNGRVEPLVEALGRYRAGLRNSHETGCRCSGPRCNSASETLYKFLASAVVTRRSSGRRSAHIGWHLGSKHAKEIQPNGPLLRLPWATRSVRLPTWTAERGYYNNRSRRSARHSRW